MTLNTFLSNISLLLLYMSHICNDKGFYPYHCLANSPKLLSPWLSWVLFPSSFPWQFRSIFLTTNLLTVYFILLLCVHSPLPFLQLSICWHDSVGGMGLRSHKADGWGIQLVRPVFKFTIHHSLVSWPGIVLCFKNLICEMVKWEDNS